MKKSLIFLLLFEVCLNANAQNIVQYEYWYDTNYSGNTVVNNTPETTLNLNTVLAGTTGLTPGLHNVNFRAKDANGKWSVAIMEQFYNTGNWNIDSYEYWFDDNNASRITNAVSPTQTYILASDFDTSAASYGLHALNFRSKDNAGKWSVVIREYFFKSVGGTQLSNAEYWIDADFANRQPLMFTSSNSVFINQSVLTSNLDDQLHTFNFRMQDQAGKWSVVTSSYFMAQSQIIGYEYWFDSSYNLKTEVNIAPTNLLTSQPNFDSSSLSEGIHVVHFRAKNSSGKYSVAISQTFTVDFDEAFPITASTGANGSISPIGVTNVIAETNQTYSITPDSCYQIADVLVDGVSQGAIATYSFTNVTTTHTISATFISNSITFYQDADGDGYGNPTATITACVAPLGYVTTGTDCNDTIAAINPGHVEVLYNGVDDNCNGSLDEGFQITTQMMGCGSTLASISSLISAVSSPAALITGYRFEVTRVGSLPLEVQTIDRTTQYFNLAQLPLYAYAATYSVRCMLQRNGIWLGYYGATCNISSPAVLASGGVTTVTPSQCGITLPTISSLIATTSLAGVTGYKFRVTNQRTLFQQELIRTLHWFSLNMLTQYVYGDTYTVEVAVKTTGIVYSGYGSPCNVTAPPVPSLTSQCNTIIPAKSTNIATSSLNLVTSYDFEVKNMVSNAVANVSNNLNWFRLSMLPNYAQSTQFRVRVRVLSSGVFSDYGDACFITSPAIARAVETVNGNEFEVTASPNPFDNNFGMFLNSTSTEDVSIRVYDMIGKLVEQREVKSGDVVIQEIGARFPSGVYNVVVTQGTKVKTLRLIKR